MLIRNAWSDRETQRLCEYMAADIYSLDEIAWLMDRTYDDVWFQWRRITGVMQG